MTLTVGQKLWYVPNGRSYSPYKNGCEVTVEKIGRKWADIGKVYERINIETLEADGRGYSSPGRCFISQEVYEVRKRANKAWHELFRRHLLYGSAPEGVTEDIIRQAADMLGMPIGELPDERV